MPVKPDAGGLFHFSPPLAAHDVICYNAVRRQVVLPVGSSSHPRTNAKGGDHMTDYEMIMVFLTFLTLLIMASKKNNR